MSGQVNSAVATWPRYALPRGTTLNGYTIERVLGSGGFGVTYLARDDIGQHFAIKEYFPREFATRQELAVLAASDEHASLFADCLDRFRREAQALVRLGQSPGITRGIVRVVTYFTGRGTGYLVMEYVEGLTLAAMIRREPGGLSAERVRSLLPELLSSVAVVHRSGLLHRDIKPANIILREGGGVVLIDFGSSREAPSGLTRTHTQIYSSGYAPLEQMICLRQGPFSDIYAIGAVCYHAIGGKLVDALTRHLALLAGKMDPQPPATRIGAGRYPQSLLKAIDAALQVSPEQRPQDVDAMFAILRPVTTSADATVRMSRPELPPPRTPSRHRKWAIAAVLGSLVLVGTASVIPWGRISDWETARRGAARREADRQEMLRQEALRKEAERQEAARQEAERQEAARQEAARQEAARLEATLREAARREAALREATRPPATALATTPQATTPPATTPLPPPENSAWTDAERRQVQSALNALGYYRGPISGSLDPDTRSAIRRWQAFNGLPESDQPSNEQRDQISSDAESLAMLLKVPAQSPRGTPAETVKGGQSRFSRGSSFERGEGQPKDLAEAAYWYALAANDGVASAFTNLGALHARGQGIFQPDPGAAQRLWMTAGALGEGSALFNLGALAENGIGGPADLRLARRWYGRCADRKNPACAAALKRLGG